MSRTLEVTASSGKGGTFVWPIPYSRHGLSRRHRLKYPHYPPTSGRSTGKAPANYGRRLLAKWTPSLLSRLRHRPEPTDGPKPTAWSGPGFRSHCVCVRLRPGRGEWHSRVIPTNRTTASLGKSSFKSPITHQRQAPIDYIGTHISASRQTYRTTPGYGRSLSSKSLPVHAPLPVDGRDRIRESEGVTPAGEDLPLPPRLVRVDLTFRRPAHPWIRCVRTYSDLGRGHSDLGCGSYPDYPLR